MAETATYDPERAAARIKALRMARGWSLRALARRVGISPTHMSRIERACELRLSLPVQRAIAAELGWPSWEAMLASDALEDPGRQANGDNLDDAVRRALARVLLGTSRRGTGPGNDNVKLHSREPGDSSRISLPGDDWLALPDLALLAAA